MPTRLDVYTCVTNQIVEALERGVKRWRRPWKVGRVTRDPWAPCEKAERFFRATGAEIHHGGQYALYNGWCDCIFLPPREAFRDAASYYVTLAHESVHWTRAKSRLKRNYGRERFNGEDYAREELVAELGAAFLCADFNLLSIDQHASYIGRCFKTLKGDKWAFFWDARLRAERAVEFLHGLQHAEMCVRRARERADLREGLRV